MFNPTADYCEGHIVLLLLFITIFSSSNRLAKIQNYLCISNAPAKKYLVHWEHLGNTESTDNRHWCWKSVGLFVFCCQSW